MDEIKVADRGKWFYNHPKVLELKQLGIKDESDIYNAMTVYIYLIEVKHWFDVSLHAVSNVNKVLVSGYRDKEKASKEVFLPMCATSTYSPSRVSDILAEEAFRELTDKKCLNVAVVGADSKIVFYKVSEGLVPPSNIN
eukprot:Seg1353.4 transcript_id=Seg1353.4/GoldUCD/mRNA.D3Y31 product="tRNA-splicing endonuclease subunit Sen15" protein_id=Seg1353.4/GoldUCD/D3Y31